MRWPAESPERSGDTGSRPFGLAPRYLRESQPRLSYRKKHATVVFGRRLFGQLQAFPGMFPVIRYRRIHPRPAIWPIRPHLGCKSGASETGMRLLLADNLISKVCGNLILIQPPAV